MKHVVIPPDLLFLGNDNYSMAVASGNEVLPTVLYAPDFG